RGSRRHDQAGRVQPPPPPATVARLPDQLGAWAAAWRRGEREPDARGDERDRIHRDAVERRRPGPRSPTVDRAGKGVGRLPRAGPADTAEDRAASPESRERARVPRADARHARGEAP